MRTILLALALAALAVVLLPAASAHTNCPPPSSTGQVVGPVQATTTYSHACSGTSGVHYDRERREARVSGPSFIVILASSKEEFSNGTHIEQWYVGAVVGVSVVGVGANVMWNQAGTSSCFDWLDVSVGGFRANTPPIPGCASPVSPYDLPV